MIFVWTCPSCGRKKEAKHRPTCEHCRVSLVLKWF